MTEANTEHGSIALQKRRNAVFQVPRLRRIAGAVTNEPTVAVDVFKVGIPRNQLDLTVELDQLTKVYPDGTRAVKELDLSIGDGEFAVLVGPSGCGKTTAMLALMGLLPPTASVDCRVLLDGDDMLVRGDDSVSPHRWRDVAMVFQGAMNAFNPVRRIGAQIVEPMELGIRIT